VKNASRLVAVGSVVLAGALAMAACGTNSNGGTTTSKKSAPGSCGKGTINAAGSTAQANAMTQWITDYQQQCPGARINYNADGSGAGADAFIQGSVSFAGSDSALTSDQLPQATGRCKTGQAVDLPMVVGPIAVAVNLPKITSIKLDPTTLASIFAGKITNWNNAAIAKDNPGVSLPNLAIKPLHRTDSSGTTDNFTKYLGSVAPSVWKYPHSKTFPTGAGGQGFKGSSGVSTGVKQNSGAIAYTEMSYTLGGKLDTAQVQNAAGNYETVSPSTASSTVAGAQIAGTGKDLSLSIDYKTTVATAYPIVLVTYEIACTKGLAAEQATFVKSFLTYTASTGQSAITGLGYAPLPTNIDAKVKAVIAGLS
jgi:phosphate transport system substrate-binding protein